MSNEQRGHLYFKGMGEIKRTLYPPITICGESGGCGVLDTVRDEEEEDVSVFVVTDVADVADVSDVTDVADVADVADVSDVKKFFSINYFKANIHFRILSF